MQRESDIAAMLRLLVASAGFGLTLTRWTADQPVAPLQVVVTIIAWAAIGLIMMLVLAAVRRWPAFVQLLSLVPVLIVGGGIFLPYSSPSPIFAAVMTMLALIPMAIIVVNCRRRASQPLVAEVFIWLACLTGLTWLMEPGDFPLTWITMPLGGLWMLFMIWGKGPRSIAAGAVASIVISLLPASPPRDQWTATGEPPNTPDVVLFTIDTMRADTAWPMESYQRLAECGTSFEQTQTTAPWTLPAMASIHTGLAVNQHGAGRVGPGVISTITDGVTTLAERLQRHGYDTAAVMAGNPYLVRKLGFGRGFARWNQSLPRPSAHLLPRPLPMHRLDGSIWRRAVNLLLLRSVGWDTDNASDPAEEVVARAKSLLAERRQRPLFLWVHFMDVHRPYAIDEQASEWLDTAILRQREGQPPAISDEELNRVTDTYRREARVVDHALMELLDVIGFPAKHVGQVPRTVVVLTADHGEEFLDHGELEHGHSLYQELISVPLVVAGPHCQAGQIATDVVGVTDIAPTILAAAGIHDPALPGYDLCGGTVSNVAYVSENLLFGEPGGVRALRRGEWKMILRKNSEPELYNLSKDPREKDNISATASDEVQRLRALLGITKQASPGGQPVSLNAAERERLRALGY